MLDPFWNHGALKRPYPDRNRPMLGACGLQINVVVVFVVSGQVYRPDEKDLKRQMLVFKQ